MPRMALVVSSRLVLRCLSSFGQVRIQRILFIRQIVFVSRVVVRVGLELAVVIVGFLGLPFLSHEGSLRDPSLHFWAEATRPGRFMMTRAIVAADVAIKIVNIVNVTLGTSRRGHHGENH